MRMSYLISLHSYARTFVQHGHFSRIIYVRRLTFIRVQGLFYMFFTFYKSSGMFESFSITFSVFQILTDHAHALATTGRLWVCVWAAFKQEHDSKVTAGLRWNQKKRKKWNKYLHVAAAGHGLSNIWPSTILLLCLLLLLLSLLWTLEF